MTTGEPRYVSGGFYEFAFRAGSGDAARAGGRVWQTSALAERGQSLLAASSPSASSLV